MAARPKRKIIGKFFCQEYTPYGVKYFWNVTLSCGHDAVLVGIEKGEREVTPCKQCKEEEEQKARRSNAS